MRRALCLALVLVAPTTAARAVDFSYPVRGDAVITAYFDLGGVRDWNCGDHTYGGHHGTDIGIIGRFAAMDEGRDAVAGAAGRVTFAHDGEFDRCTTGDCAGGSGFGNYVRIEHDDGKVTYYGHMRQGSVVVSEGQQVACGQKLGQVGSSGHSTGPHLHFEVRVGGTADDPYTGPCGGPLSYWVDQGGYRGLPAISCADAPPPDPPPPPQTPDFHLDTGLDVPDRTCDFDACADMIRGGRSGGVPDAWVGDTLRWTVVVHNRGDGNTRAESAEDAAITLRYRVPAGLTPVRYLVETDHPALDRTTWQRNDAMDNAANPPEDAPPTAGDLRLNGFGAGEAKRVTLWLRADRATAAEGTGHLRAWINHVRGYYGEKVDWDDPVEVNDGQTFNGGDLRVERAADTFDPTAFDFEADDPDLLEGWRACAPDAIGALRVEGGRLVGELSGGAPCLESPPVAVPLGGYGGVRVVMSTDAGPARARLAWSLAGADGFAPGDAIDFDLRGDGADEATHLGPPWSGTLTRLRLWPLGEAGAPGQRVSIDAVRLTADAPPPTPEAPPEDAGAFDPEPGDPRRDAALGGVGPVAPIGPDAAPAAVEPRGGSNDDARGTDGVLGQGGCRAGDGPLSLPPWAAVLLGGALRRRRGRRRADRTPRPAGR